MLLGAEEGYRGICAVAALLCTSLSVREQSKIKCNSCYKIGITLFLRDSAAQALPACAIPAPLRGACNKLPKSPDQASLSGLFATFLRRKRDSNPRYVAVQQFSRLPPSTTRPFLRIFVPSPGGTSVQIYEIFDKIAKFA